MKRLFVLFLLCAGIPAFATTRTSDGTPADTQAKINLSVSGDTVVVTAGSYTWNAGVAIPGTAGIFLDGTGVTLTRGAFTGPLITLVTNPLAGSRISGFTINQTTTTNMVLVSGGFANTKFRFDHCTFSTTSGSAVLWTCYDSYGLIDHCTFVGDDASEMIHNMAWGAGVTTGWSDVVVPGSVDALYVEDCTFSKYDQADQYFWGTSAIQSYYGARTVFRYNTLNYCQVDQHGTPGSVGARWWEIYENDFYCPANSGQSNWMALRAGSGVMFNNRMHPGSGAINPTVVLYEEDSGYPALYQIGRGIDQTLYPAYCWNNDRLPASGSSNVVDGRDFYSNTIKPGYTAYTYPDPLQGGGSTAPVIIQAPSGVNAVVGDTVTFSATASGVPTPTWQWKKNTVDIGGATASTYSISNVQTSHAGNYTAVATNTAGSATSSIAALVVATSIVPNPTPVHGKGGKHR